MKRNLQIFAWKIAYQVVLGHTDIKIKVLYKNTFTDIRQ